MAKNTQQFAQESFTGLPTWSKGVVAVAIVGGIGYLIYSLLKKAGDVKEDKSERFEDNEWNKEFDKLQSNQSTKATLTKAQMASIANKVFAAMDGYGTDEEAIVAAFRQLKNNADYAGVQAVYGIKSIHPGTGTGWFIDSFKGNMTAALTDELTQYWKDKINAILKSKKIKYSV